ncbi:heterokaryon incompatibility protein-domain-containing protein [Xylariales sp. AK1849]|nr:heterokaryon incompatibility protein-domain-containing protein [Xylariales sp. AK1849]
MGSKLCNRCKVLEFDDSAIGNQAGNEEEGYWFEVRRDQRDIYLDFDLEDTLPDLPVLYETANIGCDLCMSLYKAIRACNFDADSISAKLQLKFDNNKYSPGGPIFRPLRFVVIHLTLRAGHVPPDPKRARINGNLNPRRELVFLSFIVEGEPTDPCGQWFHLEPPPHQEALCPENLRIVQELLNQNEELKQQCSTFKPSRLIDVRPKANYDCRLATIPSDALVRTLRYAALSYCWGSKEDAKTQFQLKRNNLDALSRGFHLSSVNRILKDAVETTRALSIDYLWVDAVCIVQDDGSDWERESGRMCQIYENACVTLCAAASGSCHEGYLGRSNDFTSVDFQSVINPTIRGSFLVRWHSTTRTPISFAGHSLDHDMDCRWSTRAWTFQEFKLSRHALIFGKTRLHMLTRNSQWSEGKTVTPNRHSSLAYTSDSLHDYGNGMTSRWCMTVHNYCKRNLSFSSDLLPALSGLAMLASKSEPAQYLAGIRRDKVYLDLLWKEDRPCLPEQFDAVQSLEAADKSCQAPSWSWASQPRMIWHVSTLHDALFNNMTMEDPEKEYEIIQGSATLSGLDPFGAVKGGSLTFTGTIVALPEELEVNEKDVGYGRFETSAAYVREALVATVMLDWSIVGLPPNFTKSFSLALLGSCRPRHWVVADKSDSGSIGTECSEIDQKKGIDEYSIQTAQEDGNSNESGASRFITADKSGLTTDFQSIQSLGETPTSDNESQGDWITIASEEESERFAYGIVIYPSASKPGKYFRAGLFSSNPKTGGGLKYFRGHNDTKVDII